MEWKFFTNLFFRFTFFLRGISRVHSWFISRIHSWLISRVYGCSNVTSCMEGSRASPIILISKQFLV